MESSSTNHPKASFFLFTSVRRNLQSKILSGINRSRTYELVIESIRLVVFTSVNVTLITYGLSQKTNGLRIIQTLFNQQTRSLYLYEWRYVSCLSYPTCWSFTKETNHASVTEWSYRVDYKLFGGYCGQDHLLPFRTEKLSCPAPMVLGHWSRESRSPPIFESLIATLRWGFLHL